MVRLSQMSIQQKTSLSVSKREQKILQKKLQKKHNFDNDTLYIVLKMRSFLLGYDMFYVLIFIIIFKLSIIVNYLKITSLLYYLMQ